MADAPPTIAERTVLKDRYEIRRRIGEGGMGAVYEAFDLLLEKRVAVKVLRPELAHNENIAARFALEAKVASAFQHPNVATTFDVGTHGDSQFLVMEFLEGRSLAAAIERSSTLSERAAIALIDPIARALARAHQAGVIHRDVKPENIFLCVGERADECVPKLVDFGIARRTHNANLKLTSTAAIIGTPAYMPPEQARGADDITPAVDQYALAVVLYELLSGAHPHSAPSTPALLARKLIEPAVDLRAVAPMVSDAVATVVMRALEADPAARFADVNAMREALDRAVGPLDYPRFPAQITEPRVRSIDSGARTEPATPTPSNAALGTADTHASEPGARGARGRRGRSPLWIGAALFAGMVLVIAGLRRLQAPSVALGAPPMSTAIDAAAPANATITVVVQPSSASITIDGRHAGTGTASATVAAGATVEISMQAEGYSSRTESRVLRGDERIERVLEPGATAPHESEVARAAAVIDASAPAPAAVHARPATHRPPAHNALQLGRTGIVLDTEIQRR